MYYQLHSYIMKNYLYISNLIAFTINNTKISSIFIVNLFTILNIFRNILNLDLALNLIWKFRNYYF